MKKAFRKSLSWLLSVVMVFGVIATTSFDLKADAAAEVIERALSWALGIANDDTHNYVYGASHGAEGVNYDCSSFVSWALKHAGLDVPVCTTSNMKDTFTKYNFTWIPWSNISSVNNLQRGDILLDEGKHTEFYYGNSQIVGAHNSNSGISLSNYYNNYNGVSWDGILRYGGTATIPVVQPSTDTCSCSEAYAGEYIVTTESKPLNIRAGHGTNYSSVGLIPKGTQIYVTKADGTWAHVNYNNISGYVKMSYLQKVETQPVPLPGTPVNPTPTDDSNVVSWVDYITAGNNCVNVKGWAFDADDITQQPYVDVYIGGVVGSPEAEGHRLVPNVYRPDVNKAKGCGDYHGFIASLYTRKTGVQPVYIYANNIGAGSVDPCLGTAYVNITDPPKDLGTGFYAYIVNTESGKVAGVSNDNVQLTTKTDANNQQWYFVRQDDCSYEIKNPATGKCLEVAMAGTENGSEVRIWGDNDTVAQRWYIVGTVDMYSLVPKYATNMAMDIQGAVFSDGTNIQLWEKNNTNAQLFSFRVYDADTEKPVITNVHVSDISKDGYRVSCNVSDNVGVVKISFPTWTEKDGQDDIIYYDVKPQGTLATQYVKASEHNNELGPYITHIYVYDAAGNYSVAGCGVPSLVQYQITYDLNGGKGSFEGQTAIAQQEVMIWENVPERDEYEFIGWNTDKDATSAQYQPGDLLSVNNDTTLYAIWKINHSYTTKVVAPTCTEKGYTLHTCSNCGDSYKDTYTDALGHSYTETVVAPTKTEKGYTLHTCTKCGDSYKDNYTDTISDIAPESLILDKETVDLAVGQIAIVKATVTPSDATDKNVTWTSTNAAVATVSDGVISAVGNGQSVVVAKTGNGLTQYVIVNVKASAALTNNSKISATSVTAGTKVTLTGKAAGGAGSYTYALMYKKHSASTWTKIGEKYTSVNTGSFTPKTATTYDVRIIVKDANGKTVKKDFTLEVKAAAKALTNKSTVSATEVTKGTKVTLTAKAEGGTAPYTYALMYKKSTSSTWTKIGTKYGTASTGSFKPGSATTYDIMINVKDSTGKVKSKTFTLTVK